MRTLMMVSELFGGTVNVKYAAVAFTEDDSFDWDESWTGKDRILVFNSKR